MKLFKFKIKNAEAIKTSAFDSLWAIIIYFGFRVYFGNDLELIPTIMFDVSVVIIIVAFVFVAGITG